MSKPFVDANYRFIAAYQEVTPASSSASRHWPST